MPSVEQRRLEGLIARQELLVRDAFGAFLSDARSDRTMREVADLLRRRDVDAAMRIVDSYVVRMGTVIPKAFAAAADASADEVARRLSSRAAGAAVAFDPTDPTTAQLMRSNQMNFVREFTQEQRRATARALGRAYATGAGTADAADAFRDSIGLTDAQELAVQNYENLLRRGSAEALDRQLRDRRYDPSVRRATREGEPLRPEQIERMTDRYRSRYLDYRAETIARTEGVRVTSEARREATRQAMRDLNIPPNDIVRVWNTTQDARTRDSHVAMDGQEVGADEPFTSGAGNLLMFPGDPAAPPEETINCRCVVTTRLKEAA